MTKGLCEFLICIYYILIVYVHEQLSCTNETKMENFEKHAKIICDWKLQLEV